MPPAIHTASQKIEHLFDDPDRLHLDVNPTDREQDDEVRRLLHLGARRADVGQGEQSWVVLADPEGNESCVLASRHP